MRKKSSPSPTLGPLMFIPFFLAVVVGCSELAPMLEAESSQAENSRDGEVISSSDSGMLPDDAFSGKISEVPVEIFFAEDITSMAEKKFSKMLQEGIELWGNYGPTEVYVVGIDEGASDQLHEFYCNRRGYSEEDCASLQESEQGMEYYREIGLEGQSDYDLARTEAAWVGSPSEGFHMLVFSRPHGLEGKLDWDEWQDESTILHEYWHVVQSAHVSNAILRGADVEAAGPDGDEWDQDLYDERYEEWTSIVSREGPQWFIEGSADFMAYLELDRLVESGKVSGSSATEYEWEPVMLSKLESGLETEWDILKSLEDTMSYDLGSWAIAFLLAEHGEDVLLNEFYPQLMEFPTWEDNFAETFGITTEAFYEDFEAFLQLSNDELSLKPEEYTAETLLGKFEEVTQK